MGEYISLKAAIAYIRKQSEECQKAFEELGGESGIYADAYNDLAEDFYSIPAADVAPVVHCKGCQYWQDNNGGYPNEECRWREDETPDADDFCSYGKRKDGDDNADD